MMSTTKTEKKVQFQEVPDEDDASSVSSISDHAELDATPSASPKERVISRNEKKARKFSAR